MGQEVRPIVHFRIRKDRDNDIKETLEGLPDYIDRSDFIRDAIRAYSSRGSVLTPFENNPPQNGVKRDLNVDLLKGVELKEAEKNADLMDDALDDLLCNF